MYNLDKTNLEYLCIMKLNVSSFGLLLLLKIQSHIAYHDKDPSNADDCACGLAVPGEIVWSNKRKSKDANEEDDPYQPNYRPWHVSIEVKSKNESIYCSGAILSPIYIITSKSCLCFNKHGCNIIKHKTHYKHFELKVFYGENEMQPKDTTKYIKVKKISLPKFDYHYTDILLLRLKEKIPSLEASPICLIQENMTDEDVDVSVSGYNFGERQSKCVTARGPNPRTPCKFPFIHNDRGKEEFIRECSNTVEPPTTQECKLLKHTKKFLPNDIRAITIVKKEENGTKKIDCYNQLKSRTYGWCGTANIDAKKGEMGYFGKDAAQNSSEPERFLKEIPRPTEEDGWGFCSNACMIKPYTVGDYLLEHGSKVLSHKKCNRMTNMIKLRRGESKFKTYYEPKKKIKNQYSSMCIYQKRRLTAHDIYKMSPPPGPDINNQTEFKKYYKKYFKKFEKVFHLVKENSTKLYAPNEEIKCFADAGSPVFMWKKNKERNITNAILVGVTSLSLKNINVYKQTHYNVHPALDQELSPLLISRVKPLIDWIKSKISKDKSHKCIPYKKI